MLTIFTVPKPFQGKIAVIQTNAIKSWTMLRPGCEIILLGKEQGTAELASELGIRHLPDIECNEYGTPLVSSMFSIAQGAASNKLMCYVNADIILLSDFLSAVQRIGRESFLMVGQRWDIAIDGPVDFGDAGWEARLRALVAERGRLHPVSGIDYFVFPRGLYTDIPPFALGRTAWDNWLVYRARSSRITVIDATEAITAIHQDHGYGHVLEGKAGAFKGPEAVKNQELLGDPEHSFCPGHATWLLTPRGLRRALTIRHVLYQFDAIPVLWPRLRFLGVPKRMMIALSMAIRSKLGKPK